MEFKDFCKKTAENIGLVFYENKHDKSHGGAYINANSGKAKYYIEFSDLSFSHPYFIAEMFEYDRRLYVGTVSLEIIDGKKEFEHFETQVSPDGRYNSEFMPCDENGNQVDGQLWQFYCGKSLKWACNSFLKGGAMINRDRKPIKVW